MKFINKTITEKCKKRIFNISSSDEFNELALMIFQFQYENCAVYKKYIDTSGININSIESYSNIPFLPVEFFKRFKVSSGEFDEDIIFQSSGTTRFIPAKHYVADLELYNKSFLKAFSIFWGNVEDYCILGLLPSYLERKASSLVYMVDSLIKKSNSENSGFYLYEYEALKSCLLKCRDAGQKAILFGVSFALLDFAENHTLDFPELIIIETGGMKGRKIEIIKEELYKSLRDAFNVKEIHGEYGMTELLSQAYSLKHNRYTCPPWMKVMAGDIHDPFSILSNYQSGNIKVIDLANIYSCSFISTQDLGITYPDGTFEVLGRIDYSDIRGCSLLV